MTSTADAPLDDAVAEEVWTRPPAPTFAVPLGIAAIFVAALGMWSHTTATSTYLYDEAESSLAVTAMTLSQVAAQALIMLPAGVIIDRFGPRRSLTLGACGMTLAALLASFAASLDGTASVVGLVASMAVLSIGTACYTPIMQATLPALVTPVKVAGLITMTFAVTNSAQVFGPQLGTLDFGGMSLSTRYLCNIVLFVPLVLFGSTLGALRPDPHADRAGLPASTLRSCLDHIKATPFLRFGFKIGFSVGFLMDPPITLGPAIGESLSDASSAASTVLTAFALGSVIGGVRSRTIGAGLRPAAQSLAVATVGYALAALAPTLWVAAIGLFMGGAAFLWLGSALYAKVFELVPVHLRGKMMALWGASLFSGRILASVAGGIISDLTGPQLALGGVSVVAAILCVLIARKHRALSAQGISC